MAQPARQPSPFEKLPLSKEEWWLHKMFLHTHRVFKRAVVLLYPNTDGTVAKDEEDDDSLDFWSELQPDRETLMAELDRRLKELNEKWEAYKAGPPPTQEEVAERVASLPDKTMESNLRGTDEVVNISKVEPAPAMDMDERK